MIQKLAVLAVLGICSYEDMKYKHIRVIWPALSMAAGVFIRLLEGKQQAFSILPAVLPGFFVFALSYAARGGIGEGDALVLLAIGILVGGECVMVIFIYALFLAGCYAVYLFLFKKKSRKYEIAFVPFLLAAFVGELMLRNY
ncbi:MAG: prepilin peptidase [Eubacterium sp.]|nr:prepilin peptidase [Eubacterium sp.]